MATEVVLEGYGKLNIKEGTNFPLNFNIQNLTKPESTPASYSKDIVIIGDKNTNKILGQAFDVNISDSSYDINKKVGCNVIQDNATVFDGGYFQLLKVTKTGQSLPNGDPKIEYVGRVKSNLMSFFTSIKELDLTDLNLGGFDTYEVLNRQNILNSFSNDSSDKWKYIPLYKATNTNNFLINQWKPGIYARTFWDEIHNQNGWQYEFEEADPINGTIPFDKLIIPYTQEFDVDEDTKSRASVEGNSSTYNQYNFGCKSTYQQFGISNQLNGGLPTISTINKDNFNQFNNTNSVYTSSFNGNVTLRWEFDYDYILENPDSGNVYLDGQSGDILDINQQIQFVNNIAGWVKYSNKLNIGKFEVGDELSPGFNTISSGKIVLTLTTNVTAGEEIQALRMWQTWINATDETRGLTWRPSSNPSQSRSVCGTLNINNTKLDIIPELEYGLNTPIYIQQFIPRDVKQRDFVKSIIDMYKLVVDIDPENDNKLIYKTRDKYYDDGSEKNWSKKLDTKNPINLEWLVDKQPKKMKFTYTQDEDEYNKTYFNHIKDIYGEFEFDFGNDYNIGTDEHKIIFSPTAIQYSEAGNMFLPSLPLTESENLNIRLLIDGGIKTDGYWTLANDDGSISSQVLTDYPYYGHTDDPIRPSFDINFGTCEFYFYNNWEFQTYNNLFNLYHRRYISQLTKGRMMTAYFNLTPTDILNINLNDKIFINDAWWNINRIIDYNANSNSPTKVELVTIDDGLSIKPKLRRKRPVKPSPNAPYIGLPNLNYSKKEIFKTNNISKGFVGEVYGKDNEIKSDASGVVIGDNNFVGGNSIIIGKNSSDDGLSGKLVVGTNNTANSEYDAFIGETQIGDDIKINETTFSETGMSFESQGVTSGVTFGLTQSGGTSSQVIIQGDSAVFDVTEIDLSSVNIIGLTASSLEEVLEIGNTTNGNDLVIDNGDILDVEGTLDLTDANIVGDIIDILYSNLLTLKNSDNLQPGRVYHITDRDIWLRALTEDSFAIEGSRRMRCPKETYYTPQIVTGIQDVQYLGIYGQTIAQGSVPNSSLIIGVGVIYYAIWGGKIWQRNTSGVDGGTTVQDIIDGGGWTQIATNSNLYEDCYFSIMYNFDDDEIEEQRDWKGNVVYAVQAISIDSTDWNLSTITYNECSGFYNNFNFNIITNTTCRRSPIYFNNLGGSSISLNICGGGINNNITTDNIYGNITESSISGNTVIGIARNRAGQINNNNMPSGRIERNNTSFNINNNTIGGNIANNSNNGIINGNSNSGSIQFNSNNGNINNNSNSGNINNNSNNDDIDNNGNVGDISYNSNLGSINNNVNSDDIEFNSNAGDINSNSNTFIRNNTNGGNIFNNSCIGSISNNSNGGNISSNSNSGAIIRNSNGWYIENNSNGGNIRANNNGYQINNNNNTGVIQFNSNTYDITNLTSSVSLVLYNNSSTRRITGGSGIISDSYTDKT